MEADGALRSCSHSTDSSSIPPTSDKNEKSSPQKDEQDNHLCKEVGKIDEETKDSTNEASLKPIVPDMGLDAMAAAVSLRCLTGQPSSSSTAESNSRSSLDDLLDAANRYVPSIFVGHAMLSADSVRCCILLFLFQYLFNYSQ